MVFRALGEGQLRRGRGQGGRGHHFGSFCINGETSLSDRALRGNEFPKRSVTSPGSHSFIPSFLH